LSERTPFEILGVSPDAEPEVIAAAYRALAKKHHPDVIGEGASQARMRDLNWARDELQRDLAGWRTRVAQPAPPTDRGGGASATAASAARPGDGATRRRSRRKESLGVTVQPSFIFLDGRKGATATVRTYADDVARGAIKARFGEGAIDVQRTGDSASGSTFRVTVAADLPSGAAPFVEHITFRAPGNSDAIVRVTLSAAKP
jgi:hypothetical protein